MTDKIDAFNAQRPASLPFEVEDTPSPTRHLGGCTFTQGQLRCCLPHRHTGLHELRMSNEATAAGGGSGPPTDYDRMRECCTHLDALNATARREHDLRATIEGLEAKLREVDSSADTRVDGYIDQIHRLREILGVPRGGCVEEGARRVVRERDEAVAKLSPPRATCGACAHLASDRFKPGEGICRARNRGVDCADPACVLFRASGATS